MHPIVKILKIPGSLTLIMAFRATACRIVCHPTAGSDDRVRQITPRRWNSTNDWPAGLQFMPIKMQNYDVCTFRRLARQMAFLGFRPGLNQYARGRIPSSFGSSVSITANSPTRSTIRVQNDRRVKNRQLWLSYRVVYTNTSIFLQRCAKTLSNFSIFICGLSQELTRMIDERILISKITSCWRNRLRSKLYSCELVSS